MNITIDKIKNAEGEVYYQNNGKAADYALEVLKGDTFKFWYYLNKNKHKYSFNKGFYYPYAEIACHMSKSTCQRAFKTLLEMGFITQIGKDNYVFHEMPKAIKNEIDNNGEIELKQESTKQLLDDGFLSEMDGDFRTVIKPFVGIKNNTYEFNKHEELDDDELLPWQKEERGLI